MTSQIFPSKQEWLDFKQAWATFVNAPEAKPRFEEFETQHTLDTKTGLFTRDWNYHRFKHGEYKFVKQLTKRKIPGWVDFRYIALYNVLHERPIARGFDSARPITLEQAKDYVETLVKYAKMDHAPDYVKRQLNVYGGAVTVEHLKRVNL